jgi:hypothetical protein
MSLLEVLVAGSILAAGLAAIASAVPLVLQVMVDVREMSDADRVTAATVEQVVMTWAADPARLEARGSFRADATGRENASGRFAVAWSLEPDRPVPGNTRVDVTVTWTAANRRARRRQLLTYVTGTETPPASASGGP